MSDADDSGFDKEAERERLREKYERDQADREAAQQMSDLLLKGATMTNSHCGQCGSPLFRVDGEEFCPNCNAEGETAADAGDAAADPSDADGASEASDSAAARDPSTDERLADAVSSGDDPEPDASAGTSIAERAAASVQSGGREAPSETPDDHAQPAADRSTPSRKQSGSTPQQAGGPDASLADAQQSLLNAIAHHARAATGADPRTARDHLEAASEAAEALAEISQ